VVAPVLFLLAGLTIRQSQTPVRSGCEADDIVVAKLRAGTPVEIRFRLADGSDCVKIVANDGGSEVVGYVSSSALAGLETFEKERTSARGADPVPERQSLVLASAGAPHDSGRNADLEKARALLASNQPEEALEILEPAVQHYRNNPGVLLLAGLAAYRSDQLDTALGYWKQSLDLAPNANLEGIYDRVKREAEADPASERLVGMRILLRYERDAVQVDAARAILGTLDQEYGRISSELGCSTSERVVAIVMNRQTYLRSTGAAEWSGGWYDGRIHIAWNGEKSVGPEMRRGLAHELVHACLTSIPAGEMHWPAWLQEGLAQKLSGDQLDPPTRLQLQKMIQAHQAPKLEDLHPDWSHMSPQQARLAYNVSLAAADALAELYPGEGLRNVLRSPERLGQVTREIDKKLGF
jgi:tetratricopeptide (TPR) repeat protein